MQFYISIYILVYFLISCTSVHTTNHYVDKNANGYNKGTSWEDAWESFSDIEWNQIQPGDIIYISGGTDSTIYYEELHIGDVDGTAEARITVRNSYDAGHNGRVIIDGQNETRHNSILIGDNSGAYQTSYVTIKGLEARGGTSGIHCRYYVDNIIIDSCIVYDWYAQAGILLQGAGTSDYMTWGISNVTIKNCRIISSQDEDDQTDGLYLQRASNLIVHDNFIHLRNYSTVNSHSDGMQTHFIRGLKVYNNTAICDSNVQGMPMILRAENTGDDADSVIIYNNFIYMGGIWFTGAPWVCAMDMQASWMGIRDEPPTIIAHNTIITNGPYVMGLWLERNVQQKTRAYNNIIAQYGSGKGFTKYWHYTMKGNALLVDSITGGLYYRSWDDFGVYGTVEGKRSTGFCHSWKSWVYNYGGTGTYGNPLFVDKIGHVSDQGTLDGELQSGSPAINAGEDIQAIIERMGLPWSDINGNPRDSTPDIGAYQYVDENQK